MKIITVIGTRPEIIKMSPLLELLNKNFEHKLIHTGQHYDPALDSALFEELKLKSPDIRLKTGSGSFDQQISKQMKGLFKALSQERPDYVIVQGDTNSAMTAAVVAARLKIGILHVEAGCRSGNLQAPEEQNRILIDSISAFLFCADEKAFQNLKHERKTNLSMVGSTTFDAIKRSSGLLPKHFENEFKLKPEGFVLATLHRAENMDQLDAFSQKINFLNELSHQMPVLFPIHPRTSKFLKQHKLKLAAGVIAVKPLTHLLFINYLKHCRLVVTDSGGIQEEAAYFDRPCLILREQTEWTRLVKAGKNFLFKKISDKENKLASRLLQDDTFYQSIRKKKAPGMKVGAAANIIKLIKQLGKAKTALK